MREQIKREVQGRRRLLDIAAFLLWHLRRRVSRWRGDKLEATSLLIHRNPQDVRTGLWRLDLLRSLDIPRQRDLVGSIRGGDWDLNQYPLSELGIFEAIRQRYEEGADWQEIPYFDEIRDAIVSGRPRFKYRTIDDIPRQWRRIDRLYEAIARDGYRSQEELGTLRPWDEIMVAIDRHGRFVFVDGRHRLAIARVLRLDRVPMIVALRHESWVATFCGIARLTEEAPQGQIPAPPDLRVQAPPPTNEPNLRVK